MSTVPSRTVRFHEPGRPLEVLREERTTIPEPPAGTVRIRVIATGLNPADIELCLGFLPGLLPRGVGCDSAGVVDAVGAGVEEVAVGELVFGAVDFAGQTSAGLADVAILSAFTRVPDGLAPEDAAALPMAVTTAAWTLDVLDPAPGSTLLVHGAGGMVGYAAVQIARRRGVRVIATAGPRFDADLASFGATVTRYGDGMADRVRALAGGDVDRVLDAARPRADVLPSLIALAGGDPGRVVTISNHEEARRLGARVNLDELTAVPLRPASDLLAEYAALAADGRFRLPIARRFRLDEWREAMELLVSGAPHGKIVVVP